jgi:hypothetical protein
MAHDASRYMKTASDANTMAIAIQIMRRRASQLLEEILSKHHCANKLTHQPTRQVRNQDTMALGMCAAGCDRSLAAMAPVMTPISQPHEQPTVAPPAPVAASPTKAPRAVHESASVAGSEENRKLRSIAAPRTRPMVMPVAYRAIQEPSNRKETLVCKNVPAARLQNQDAALPSGVRCRFSTAR